MPVDEDAGAVRSMPVAAYALRGSIVIATDAGDWMALGAGDRLAPMPSTGPISDTTLDPDGTLTVACWEPRLEQLRDGAWSRIPLGAPPTAIASTRRGLVIADASGGVSLLAGAARIPVQEISGPEPIVAIVAVGDGLVTLGASGALETTAWPGGETTTQAVHTGPIGRAHALFAGLRPGTTLVAGMRGLGVLERQRFVSVATDFADRIAGVAAFGDKGRALVHADDGGAWIVEADLGVPQRVRLGAEVAGATTSGDGTVLVWTVDGVLHVVSHDGATWQVTDGGVVLAVPEPDRRGAIAIHWSAAGGARVTRGHVAWN